MDLVQITIISCQAETLDDLLHNVTDIGIGNCYDTFPNERV